MYQIQRTWLVSLLMLYFVTNGRLGGFDPIQALVILSGTVLLGPLVGFLTARRTSAKCGAAGVYRTKAMTVGRMLLGLFLIVGPLGAYIYIGLYLLLVKGVEFEIPRPALFVLALATIGVSLSAPVGEIMFERRSGARLWVLGTPNLWISDQLEFRKLPRGVRPSPI